MSAACDVSVVLSTFDRAALLGEALRSVCRQDQPPRYEVVVVDNNSTDDTARVVADAAAGSPLAVRYFFEARQGLSHARNAGVMTELVAFTDDDITRSD